MKVPGNPVLDKHTKQWTVQRIRTKQGHIQVTGKRINTGSHGVSGTKRSAYRKFAHRSRFHHEYSRCVSPSYSEG